MTATCTFVEILLQTCSCVVDVGQKNGVDYYSVEKQSDGVGSRVVQSDVDPVLGNSSGFSFLQLENHFVGRL